MESIKVMAISSILFTSGCSSLMSRTGADQGYYAGTIANVTMMKSNETSWAMMPLLAVDLPFSALTDTLLLPYDYLHIDDDKMIRSLKARIQHDEEKNLAASGNPRQGMETPIP